MVISSAFSREPGVAEPQVAVEETHSAVTTGSRRCRALCSPRRPSGSGGSSLKIQVPALPLRADRVWSGGCEARLTNGFLLMLNSSVILAWTRVRGPLIREGGHRPWFEPWLSVTSGTSSFLSLSFSVCKVADVRDYFGKFCKDLETIYEDTSIVPV